jgi:CBS domain containing-hemolysin-like protein
MGSEIIIILLLLVANGIFSGTELAMMMVMKEPRQPSNSKMTPIDSYQRYK